MTNACHILDPQTLRLERLLPASADSVWGFLTRPECLALWLTGGDFEARVGGRVELRFDASEAKECEGSVPVIRGVVSECDPPRALAYSWAEPGGPDTFVRFELEPRGGETLLTLTHREIPVAFTAQCAAGWQALLDALAARIRREQPLRFPALFEPYLAKYAHTFAALPEVARYTCYRAPSPIRIDGKLDDPAWQAAPVSPAFADIVTGAPAWFDTRVRMLWDDDYLYFGISAEETDVWSTLTERDSKVYEENDLEIFIAGRDAYYEFQINALNTIYEAFWIWKDVHWAGGPYWGRPEFDPRTERTMVLGGVGGHAHPRGERWGFLDWDCPGLQHAVHVDGTVNKRDGKDRGWSAEIAVPWKGLALIADGRSLPPRDGDVWRIDCSRFEKIGRSGEALDPCAGWTWNRHGHYDSHIPELFPIVTFTTKNPGQ